MKYVVEIDENKIVNAIEEKLIEDMTIAIKQNWGTGYIYRKDCKEVMREIIRENIDAFAERAVAAAAKSIANRAIRQKMNELLSDEVQND